MLRKSQFWLVLLLAVPIWAQQWTPIGPDGGDVRSLARDPHAANRVFLGTSAGQLYESENGGTTWHRFAKLGDGNDYVLDAIIIHPTRPGTIYVAAWSVEEASGDIFRSVDNGRSWRTLNDMRGKSVRALAMAASNPDVLVAGALDGVFRTLDGGEHWTLISPANHSDIRNVESIAIDPRSFDVIYAGTWHLPWKTSDGGTTWNNMKKGIIDDSDVFSIIVDPVSPAIVYASACSGIYKSETSGDLFRKVQGMPYSARRTRVLMQDPVDRNVVYAGTTEGLWRSADAGASWTRLTGANIIVNDILIDPAQSRNILLATDRSGVLASRDGGGTFVASNRGFAHRQVGSLLLDRNDSSTIYAGLINDKEFGGVFVTRDQGASWNQLSSGLDGRDVFTLQQTVTGTLIAGTNQGVFLLDPVGPARWTLLDKITNITETTLKPTSKKAKPRIVRKVVKGQLASRINDLALSEDAWFAATVGGMFASDDQGRNWHGGPVAGLTDFLAVQSTPRLVVALTRRALIISSDRGKNWYPARLPTEITGLADVTIDKETCIFIASREGVYRSSDGGMNWEQMLRLPVNQLSSILFDEEGQRLLTTSITSTELFQSTDDGLNWKRAETGWVVRGVRARHGRVVATTAFDGIVTQPTVLSAPQPTVSAGGGPTPQ